VLKRILLFNLLLAAVYAAVLFVLVYAAAWQVLSGNLNNRPRQSESWLIVHGTLRDVEDFRKAHGKFPPDLKVPEIAQRAMRPGAAEKTGPLDAWNNPLKYEVHADKVTVCSLGRDGTPGGVGLDADICGLVPKDVSKEAESARFPPQAERPTFRQFLTTRDLQELSGNGVVMWAALCVVLAFGLMLITSWPIIRQTLGRTQASPALIARYEKLYAVLDPDAPVADRAASLLSCSTNAIVLVLASLLFSGVITIFHIQSGH
jgi:hypothetical protein